MITPSRSPVTLDFGLQPGYSLNDGFHKGVDFSHSPDNVVYMPEDGTVMHYPNNGADGNAIYFWPGNRMHALCHLSEYLVSHGQFVKQGTPIAIMGETGAAEGVHLHWAMQVGGQLVRGLNYVTEETNVSRDLLSKEDVIELHRAYFIGDPGAGYNWEHVGKPLEKAVADFKSSQFRQNVLSRFWAYDQLVAQLADINARFEAVAQNPNKAEFDKLHEQVKQCTAALEIQTKISDDYKYKSSEAEKTGNAFILWIGSLFNSLKK